MPSICKWCNKNGYNNCSSPIILRMFSGGTFRCSGKPQIAGGDLLPVLNVISSNGNVETYPCRSYTPIKIHKDPILVVDDDEEVCRTLARLLKLEGYEQVHTATSGKEAIVRIKVLKYDLILLDIRVPEMNGVETLREIRKYDEKVPVAMITACEDMDLAQEALHLGAYDFIKKPFDYDYLKASVLSKLIPAVVDREDK